MWPCHPPSLSLAQSCSYLPACHSSLALQGGGQGAQVEGEDWNSRSVCVWGVPLEALPSVYGLVCQGQDCVLPSSAPRISGTPRCMWKPCTHRCHASSALCGAFPGNFLEGSWKQRLPINQTWVNKGFFEVLGPLPFIPLPILDTQRAPGQLRSLPSSTGSWEEPRKCQTHSLCPGLEAKCPEAGAGQDGSG